MTIIPDLVIVEQSNLYSNFYYHSIDIQQRTRATFYLHGPPKKIHGVWLFIPYLRALSQRAHDAQHVVTTPGAVTLLHPAYSGYVYLLLLEKLTDFGPFSNLKIIWKCEILGHLPMFWLREFWWCFIEILALSVVGSIRFRIDPKFSKRYLFAICLWSVSDHWHTFWILKC